MLETFKKIIFTTILLAALPIFFCGCFEDDEKEDSFVNDYAWMAILNIDNNHSITNIIMTPNDGLNYDVLDFTLEPGDGLIIQFPQDNSVDLQITYAGSTSGTDNINDRTVSKGRVKEIDWYAGDYYEYDEPASEWEDILTELYGKSTTKSNNNAIKKYVWKIEN